MKPVIKCSCHLGESPYWHDKTNSFFWVDIELGTLFKFNFKTKKIKKWKFNHKLSLVLEADNDKLILALDLKIASFDLISEKLELLEELKGNKLVHRFNDGKCDTNGTLWIGALNKKLKPNSGSLYSIGKEMKFKHQIGNLTVSNGITWTKDNKTMYFIDSPSQEVKSYNFDLINNEITYNKVVIKISKELGAPDGMSIDKEGNLWIAHYGGHGVFCWNPKNGKILNKIMLPVPNVTSCCFGGENLDHLMITTAMENLTKKELKKFPLSGNTFIVKTKTQGFISNKFNMNLSHN